jgi:alpha-beta hydrolase superfamily lysophospholipase
MTITESVHSILASDAEPIRMYEWSGSAPARGIIQIAHGMGEHALRYRPIAHAIVDRIYSAVAVPCGNFAGWQKS